MTLTKSLAPWNSPKDVHLGAYRVFCLVAAVLTPVFGVVYQVTDPGGIDPLWIRLVLSMGLLFLLSLSYMVEALERNFVHAVQAVFYLLMLFVVGVTAVNGFAPNYSLGMLFTFTAMGVAFSLGERKRMKPLASYLGFTVAVVGVVGLAAPDPDVSLWVVWVCIASTAFIIYFAAAARVRAEGDAEASERRFHTLMDAANDSIFIADPETNALVHANQKARAMAGLSLADIKRTRLYDLFPPHSRARSIELLEAHVSLKAPISEDLFLVNATGGETAVDVNASLIVVDGHPYIQGIFRDATDRHRYEAQLIQAKEHAEGLLSLKTNLLNNMSHELRTPLTAVLGFAEVLAETASPAQREYVDCVVRGAERLYETVNSVMGLAELEAGKSRVELRPVNVAAYLRESLELLQPLADQKGISLSLQAHTAHLHASTDTACLGRIVTNLVGNAIKFTDHGHVQVTIDKDQDRIRIRVRDTGVGISPDFMSKLFDEFQQESQGIARSYEGSGLGLTITKRLVELIDGTIDVESQKGLGSTFTVTLPEGPTFEAPSAPASSARYIAVPARHRRVLVVEDNADTRSLLATRLHSLCTVEFADGPEAAFERVNGQSFDAFLLDINLRATLDGVDLLRAFRAMPACAHVPAVAMTAYAMPGDRERFLAVGFEHYLSKPFTSQDLHGVFRDLFPEPAPPFACVESLPLSA